MTKRYNGYNWDAKQHNGHCRARTLIYNPYDVNRFFNKGKWDNYWVQQEYSSRICDFLERCYSECKVLPIDILGRAQADRNQTIAPIAVKDISQLYVTDLDNCFPKNAQDARDAFISLLLTFGYMTFDASEGTRTVLKIPNAYVRAQLEECSLRVLRVLSSDEPQTMEMHESLRKGNLKQLTKTIQQFIHNTPYKIIAQDQFTEPLFHNGFRYIIGDYVRADMHFASEDMDDFGRSSLVVRFYDGLQYVIELKTRESVEQRMDVNRWREELDPVEQSVICIGICVDREGEATVECGEVHLG